MKSMRAITLELLLVMGLTVMGCSEMSNRGDTGWITLLDGSNPKTLDNWNRIGDANWRAEDGAIAGSTSGASTRTTTTPPAESLFPRLEPLLPRVSKPIQYVGGELGAFARIHALDMCPTQHAAADQAKSKSCHGLFPILPL